MLVLLAVLHLTCNQAILTAPEGATLFILANPTSIPAFGGVSVISVRVFESIGTPVADGTVVQFFTDLGRIDEQAKTNDGVARVNLVSDTRSGIAIVTAFSGGVSESLSPGVTIGNPRAARVLLVANPTRLLAQRASRIVATVIDADGNPVENVGVVFKVSTPTPLPTPVPSPTPVPTPQPPGDEFMESRGSVVFTDNNGQASDVMRTSHPPDAPARRVTVTADVLAKGSITGTVDVIIN